MELVQIVPALPPAFSGVGDFATLLARALLARHGVGGRFVVGDPAWNAPTAVAPFPAAAVTARSASVLRAQLDALPHAPGDAVLLHYVGYGYAHRGCPFWLVDGLERWQRAAAHAPRLLVLFHETFASGPVWSSAFWTRPFQKSLAARLARLADARRITTTIGRGELSGTLCRGETLPMTVAPVFSNVGEPAAPPPPAARERQVVVFGSRPVRAAVYEKCGADIDGVLRAARDRARRGRRRNRMRGRRAPRRRCPCARNRPAARAGGGRTVRAFPGRVFRLPRPVSGQVNDLRRLLRAPAWCR